MGTAQAKRSATVRLKPAGSSATGSRGAALALSVSMFLSCASSLSLLLAVALSLLSLFLPPVSAAVSSGRDKSGDDESAAAAAAPVAVAAAATVVFRDNDDDDDPGCCAVVTNRTISADLPCHSSMVCRYAANGLPAAALSSAALLLLTLMLTLALALALVTTLPVRDTWPVPEAARGGAASAMCVSWSWSSWPSWPSLVFSTTPAPTPGFQDGKDDDKPYSPSPLPTDIHVRTSHSPNAASAFSTAAPTSRTSRRSGPSTAMMGPRSEPPLLPVLLTDDDVSGGLMRSSTRSLLRYGMLMTMASMLRCCCCCCCCCCCWLTR
ncbi:hypothetical protein B0T26DRAFT_727797 [Lasiosphaeria miniovina]|uniref:Uncharacterized protein n=1 Tax=Lasiosphaeria miniovina TaxID=1954250 RepID=A0AA40A0B6_9PEZI|nr:uncharacterized protein B0T26DRAFT_727797 [Lasiosphaeria miniovina]KAK0706719.1 hypothetical protein B0T26DRAFT_727797 [Lasiosphaeria miniovina]